MPDDRERPFKSNLLYQKQFKQACMRANEGSIRAKMSRELIDDNTGESAE